MVFHPPNSLVSTLCCSVGPLSRTRFLTRQTVRFTTVSNAMNCDLYLEKNDRSVVPAKEEDFYNYTSKRWLSNITANISERYLRFNIHALLDRAVQSRGHNVQRCVRALKFREGQYNKAFLLTFDDQSQLVAKLPNPNAGPTFFTTASEVATMNFARNVLGLPVPQVLSWSYDPLNPVGSEYIIMEKAKGTPLGDVWFQLSRASKRHIIGQVVDMESRLASWQFSGHGCIYFTRDLPGRFQCAESTPLPGDSSKMFCIGPLVEPPLWKNGRSTLNTSQGPWASLIDHATSLGLNEREWARRFAKPRTNYYRGDGKEETPSEYLHLIEKYLLLTPYLAASSDGADDLLQPTLWHHDLHLNNIYIDTSTNTVTDVIDWQGVSVAPLLLQARIPRMVRHPKPVPSGWLMPEKPAEYEGLDEKAKLKVDREYDSALCHKYYEVVTAKRNPRHYSAIIHNDTWKAPHIGPLKLITGAWESQHVFQLRSSLMGISDHWDELGPASSNCPIMFSPEERRMHSDEIENHGYVEDLVEEFQENGILPADGVVDAEDYEVVQQRNMEQKKRFLSLAEDEAQRAWMDKLWPYQ